MANAITDFLWSVAEVIAGVGDGAVADIRNTWEEAWFGRALTPEKGDMVGEVIADRMEKGWDELRAEFAREREIRGQPEPELEREQGLDR